MNLTSNFWCFFFLTLTFTLSLSFSRCWNNWLDNSQFSQRHVTLFVHSVFVVMKKLPSIVRCVVLKPKKFLNVVLRFVSKCSLLFCCCCCCFCYRLHSISCHWIGNWWIFHVDFQSTATEMQDQPLSINLQQSFTQYSLLSDLHTKDTTFFYLLYLFYQITQSHMPNFIY